MGDLVVAQGDMLFMSKLAWAKLRATAHSPHVTMMHELHIMLFFKRNPHAHTTFPT